MGGIVTALYGVFSDDELVALRPDYLCEAMLPCLHFPPTLHPAAAPLKKRSKHSC